MLTQKQAQCLDLIEKHWAEFGECPSYEDLLPALGQKSKSGVNRLIVALEERGFIRRLPHRARAIEVLKPQSHLSAEYQRGFRDGVAWEAGKRGLRLVSADDPPCRRRT
jgi:repressor LexA